MPRLLFEIGTEELPAWYVAPAADALQRGFVEALKGVGLGCAEVTRFATPRRLALSADVDAACGRREEVRRGPAESAAFDAAGQPTRAALGFASSCGVEVGDLEVEEGPKGRYLVVRREAGGERAEELLPGILAELIRTLPAKRKMRWGDVDTPFVRPIAWLCALLDDAVLPLSVAGIEAGRSTRGHRFLHPEPIVLAHASDYQAALLAAEVIADRDERAAAVRDAVVAAAATGTPPGTADVADALIHEVVDLVERPFAVVGLIDERFLELPDAVLRTVMIHHQRFVPVLDAQGRLLPRFVAVANHRVADEALVRGGYERVLAGRLFDARFFWEADRRKSLSQHAWALSGVAFQRELGSMADKVARVALGATAMAKLLGYGSDDRSLLDQALPLFRADLVTEMVGELPELEGTMARAYALADGATEALAAALEDAVLPRSPEDGLPQGRVGALLSVADRLDKLLGFFAIGKRPTGSADPFALRRDGVALARMLTAQGWRVPLSELVAAAAEGYADGPVVLDPSVLAEVTAFIWDRVEGLLLEQGFDTPTLRAAVEASVAVVGAARRAHLLRTLRKEPQFEMMQALYKRAANLAEHAIEGFEVAPERFEDPAEQQLFDALAPAHAAAERLIEAMHAQIPAWDLARPADVDLSALAPWAEEMLKLKEPLDAFLDKVMVMVDDDALRANRLALLAAVAATVRGVGAIEHLSGASS